MKIGKITLDGYNNYGNVLQNYALNIILENYGEVESIWHTSEEVMPKTWWHWGWKEPIKFVLNYKGFRSKIFSDFHGMEMVRQGKIKDWCDRYISIRKAQADLRELDHEYDYFVVGSDQVWNPYFSNLNHFFLFFVPPEKRIAYAASISCPEISKNKLPIYEKGLVEMPFISMREQQGAYMVKEICGRDVPVLIDPTMLLSPNEWRKVSRQPAWYRGEDYILTYFLGRRPNVVKGLGQATGLKVVNLLDKELYEHYVTGPDEFLWAIEHAELVYTDSFHGTVFSILFNTPFVVCDRVGSTVTEKMGSRIDTLLGYFGLGNRRGTKATDYVIDNPLDNPDWSKVEKVLENERMRASDYLNLALSR